MRGIPAGALRCPLRSSRWPSFAAQLGRRPPGVGDRGGTLGRTVPPAAGAPPHKLESDADVDKTAHPAAALAGRPPAHRKAPGAEGADRAIQRQVHRGGRGPIPARPRAPVPLNTQIALRDRAGRATAEMSPRSPASRGGQHMACARFPQARSTRHAGSSSARRDQNSLILAVAFSWLCSRRSKPQSAMRILDDPSGLRPLQPP